MAKIMHGSIIEHWLSKLNEFHDAEKYTDVKITRNNEMSFKCHKIILASASNFFDTMFSANFKESIAENISLPETNGHTFKDILHFIYVTVFIETWFLLRKFSPIRMPPCYARVSNQ